MGIDPAFTIQISTGVVQTFGIESILIYNALLLKKRVVVYAPHLETLLDICRHVFYLDHRGCIT